LASGELPRTLLLLPLQVLNSTNTERGGAQLPPPITLPSWLAWAADTQRSETVHRDAGTLLTGSTSYGADPVCFGIITSESVMTT